MASATASSPRRVRCQDWSLIGRRKPSEYAARRCQRVEVRAESDRSPAQRARVHTSIVAPAGAALNVTKRPAARHRGRGDRARRSAPGVVATQPESRPGSAPADGAQVASRSTDGSVRRYGQRRPVTTEVTPLPAGHLRAGREVCFVPPWTQPHCSRRCWNGADPAEPGPSGVSRLSRAHGRPGGAQAVAFQARPRHRHRGRQRRQTPHGRSIARPTQREATAFRESRAIRCQVPRTVLS